MRSSPPAKPCRPPFNASMANSGAFEVIHNGRNAGDFVASAKEPFVLSLGRTWDEGKNLALLEKAAPTIPWPVVIAGASRVAPEEEDQRSFHHARYWAPWAAAPFAAAIEGCDLCAARAVRTLRALGARGRLVGRRPGVGDIPSFRELWEDAALYVDTEDASQLSHAIWDLIESPARQAEMGRRARREPNGSRPRR